MEGRKQELMKKEGGGEEANTVVALRMPTSTGPPTPFSVIIKLKTEDTAEKCALMLFHQFSKILKLLIPG